MSGRATPSERCSDDSEYDDDECVDVEDIIDGRTSPEDQKEDGSCDGVSSTSKFSIDNILGLRGRDEGCKDVEKVKCVKEGRFIKPTPVPAIPRGNYIEWLTEIVFLPWKCLINIGMKMI